MIKPCQQDHLLSAFLDHALSRAQMEQVRDHLRSCSICRRELAALQRTDAMIRDLPPVSPSAGFDAAFWSKVPRSEQTGRPPSWVDRLRVGWRPLLAAGVAAGLVAAFLTLRHPEPAPTAAEVFMVENMGMLSDFELLQRLDLLENWDVLKKMKEQG